MTFEHAVIGWLYFFGVIAVASLLVQVDEHKPASDRVTGWQMVRLAVLWPAMLPLALVFEAGVRFGLWRRGR